MIQEDIHDLTTLSSEMCMSGLEASKKEGIRIYLKSQGYKSKAKRKRFMSFLLSRNKSEAMRGAPWLWLD